MARALMAAAAGVAAGAATGAIAVWLGVAARPGLAFEMDRSLPAIARGVYPAERHGIETWVWVAPRAELTLAGLDRRPAWQCTVRFRGGRPPDEPQPTVTITVDGLARATVPSTNEYQDVTVTAPPAPDRTGMVLGIASSETFRPPDDPRALGVLVDRLVCSPDGAVRPASGTVAAAAAGAGVLGGFAGLAGASVVVAVAAAIVVGLLQAIALSTGAAAFTAYPGLLPWLACWIGLALFVVSRAVARAAGALTPAAHAVLALSAAAAYVKLLGLLHPSKPVIDALYHAHRLQWVLDGRFYFTQIMPNGVEFPYAVALYVIAAPWTLLTQDFVSLLRVVTVAADVAAGGLLYVAAVRIRGDRLMGLLAVLLFHTVPVAYPVIGNANLTNAFGQSVALAAVVAAVALPLASRAAAVAALAVLASVALLSHVSTFALTAAILSLLAGLQWWRGDRALRRSALRIAIALAVAVTASVSLYWAHFGDTYRTLAGVRAESGAESGVPALPEPVETRSPEETEPRSILRRVATALSLGLADLGWPMLALAALGVWRFAGAGWRDRLGFAVLAWLSAYGGFVAFAVLAPVSGSYERYAAEFIGRVDLATYPAVVLLGAAGSAWLWRTGWPGRIAAVALVGAAAAAGLAEWHAWIA